MELGGWPNHTLADHFANYARTAFKHFGKTTQSNLTMSELVDMYVKINAEAEKDPSIEDQAKKAFLALEKGDPEITALWKKCVDISIQELADSPTQLTGAPLSRAPYSRR